MDASIALLRLDGTLLMRAVPSALPQWENIGLRRWLRSRRGNPAPATSSAASTRPTVSTAWSGGRILAFDPSLMVVTGESVDHILAPWRHIVGVVAVGWLMVKNGSNTLSMLSGAIPTPVSVTASIASAPATASALRAA